MRMIVGKRLGLQYTDTQHRRCTATIGKKKLSIAAAGLAKNCA
jgi:hypothetical protein